MDTEQIIRLVKEVAASELGEFEYSEGDVKLVLKAKTPVCQMSPVEVPVANMPTPMMSIPATATNTPTAEGNSSSETSIDESEAVKSPLVGTFYSAPAEGEAPFVNVGDTVKKGQIIGIIETMKLMNEVESDRDGVVSAILIENEQVVEFGQPLVVIN